MPEYRIDPKSFNYTYHPYGLAPALTATFPANVVKLRKFPDKDIIVSNGKSGWIAVDRKTGERLGKTKGGGGWYGFNSAIEAVENYLAKQPVTATNIKEPIKRVAMNIPNKVKPTQSNQVEQRLTRVETGLVEVGAGLQRVEKTVSRIEQASPFLNRKQEEEKTAILLKDGHEVVPQREAFATPGTWEIQNGQWVKVAEKPAGRKKPAAKPIPVKTKTTRRK